MVPLRPFTLTTTITTTTAMTTCETTAAMRRFLRRRFAAREVWPAGESSVAGRDLRLSDTDTPSTMVFRTVQTVTRPSDCCQHNLLSFRHDERYRLPGGATLRLVPSPAPEPKVDRKAEAVLHPGLPPVGLRHQAGKP